MKIRFFGAARQVTGSCHLLEACGKRVLIDCGMEQGPATYEDQSIPFDVPSLDYVLVTHAHIDHSGRLPMLTQLGFKGEIYCTQATKKLCEILLKDSAHIQEKEAEWRNKKEQRKGAEKHEQPLYTMADAEAILTRFKTHEYRETFYLDGEARKLKVRFLDAGHLLGSALIEITATESETDSNIEETRTILFTGDIGNHDVPLLNDPAKVTFADYVVTESTYGDRNHPPVADPVAQLASIIEQTFDCGGRLIVPSFAVGRTQELLYYIREIKERKLVKGHGDFKVYLDSPLAIEATSIFENVNSSYYDEEARALLKAGKNPLTFSGLSLSVTQEDSQRINESDEPCVIISASGMCEAGRIRHHLKHGLWKWKNTVLFVGFQVEGTLGKILLAGAKKVKLFGEDVAVKARIVKMDSLSAHADHDSLLAWFRNFEKKPREVFVVHGEATVAEAFVTDLKAELGCDAVAPFYCEEYDLILGIKTRNGVVRDREKEAVRKKPNQATAPGSKRGTTQYRNLTQAMSKLKAVVEKSEFLAIGNLEKFTKQIEEIAKRWK